MKEAAKLVQEGVIRAKEDIYYLSLEELRETVRTTNLDYEIITRRKEEYEFFEKLTPPRVMTSEGEVVSANTTPAIFLRALYRACLFHPA